MSAVRVFVFPPASRRFHHDGMRDAIEFETVIAKSMRSYARVDYRSLRRRGIDPCDARMAVIGRLAYTTGSLDKVAA